MTTFDLSPIGGELFAGRDARRALVPTDAFQKLTKMEGEMKAPGFAEMQLDRHASALWLSGKLQRPAQEVLSNFDAYARAYWGKDVTPGQAYDRIVEYERTAMQMAAPAPQAGAKDGAKGEQATPDANAGKSWQFMRAATGGFAKAGHDTAGGTLALVEGALNTLGGMPDRKGVSEDPDFSDALFKLGVMEYDGTLDTPEGAMVKARVDAGRARLDEDFKARMEEYRATIRGGLAADVRAGADFFYELGNESAQFYGVSEDYRQTIIGKVAESGGSMIASSALLGAGSLGMLGRLGKAAGLSKRAVAAIQTGELYAANVAGAGQIYAGVEQDRMAVEGDAYRNTGWTFVAGLANAGVQQYIERAPWLDNTLEKALKRVPHKGGTVGLGDVLREMAKESLSSGIKEGTEEVLQGAWDDFIVDMSYDDTRVDWSDGKLDYLKRRVGEAVAGFGGGVMLGGVFGGAAIYDRNSAAKKAERAFASRAGEMLTPEDLAHLRRARTDEQIKAMPWGETLLAAANGDAKAAEAYNRAVFDASFVRTDGLAAFGDEVGEYKGMPAVRLSDGRRVPIDMADPEQVARFNAFRRQVAAAASGDAAVAEFQRRFGEGLTTERPAQASSLEEMVKAGTLTQEQAEDAKAVAVAMKKVAADAPLSALFPEGSARAVEDSKTRLVRMVTSVLQGKNAAVAIEETAEAWIQAAVLKGDVDRGELRTLRMDWQQANGETPAEGASEARADVEWFSRRVIEYALAGKVTEVTGSKWWRWIRTLGEQLRDVLKGAQKMRAALKDGTLDPRLEGWFQAALGMGEDSMRQADATFRAKEAEGAAQIPVSEMDPVTVQEAMVSETFPKITGNVDDGFQVTAPDGVEIGAAQDLEVAQEKAMEWWMARELAAEREQAKQDAGQQKGDELMDVIRRLGGLRAASVEGTMKGELKTLAENMSTAERLRTFRKSGKDLDRLREALVEEGFDFQTPADVLAAIERSLRGEPQYATYSNPDSLLPGAGSFSLEQRVTTASDALRSLGYAPVSSTIDRGGAHTPSDPESGAPAWGLSENGIYPSDVYGPNGLRYYGTGDEKADREVYSKLMRLAGRPDAQVRIYRSVEKDSKVKGIQPGDWVTIVRQYAEDHGKAALGGEYRIQEKLVMAGDIFTSGDSWVEWGYHPQDHAVLVRAGRLAKNARQSGETFSLAQTNTPEFKRWFGDSKVVDADGKPLVVYHGTDKQFTQFRTAGTRQSSRAGVGLDAYGAFFTPSEEVAKGHGKNVVGAYLAIENPAELNAWEPGAVKSDIADARIHRAKLIREGFDGIKLNIEQAPFVEWIAFKPTQIKSAIGNRGTFDPANPDITFSLKQGEFPGMDGGRGPGENQGELPLEYHAARRKIEDTWEKWMASQGYAELVRMRNESYVQSIITARAKHDSTAANIIESVISPTSEAIRRAGALEISRALIRSTSEAYARKERDRRVVTAYAQAVQNMDEQAAQLMDYANANGNTELQNDVAARYGFRAALDAMRAMFTRIRREAIAAGAPISTFWEKPETVPEGTAKAIKDAGRDAAKIEAILEAAGYKLRIAEYWPRSVIDYDAYLAALTGTEEGMSEMGREYQALLKRAADAGRVPSDLELQNVAEKVARGLKRGQGQGRKPGALKQRKIDVVPMEHIRFYLKSIDAAYRHVEQMQDYIQLMEFFGDKVRFDKDEAGNREPQVNVTDTVKAWLDAGEGGKLNYKQSTAVQKALEARFAYKGSPELIRHMRTFGHLTGLTQIYSPITAQVPDFWNLPIEANFNFADVVGSIYQAATGEKAEGLDQFGLNAREIVREFQTRVPSKYLMKLADALRLQGKPRKVVEQISLTAALDHLFTWTGFNKLADVANNARVLTQVKALRRAAERGSLTRIQEDRINRLMTPEERTRLIADLRAGKTAADSPLLALYMWGGIADYVPVSLDQMPPQYLKHPVGRIAYNFKSFMVIQTAAIRRIGVDNIVDGIKDGDRDKVIYGLGMLAAIIAIMQLLGVPGDMLRAYLQNRPYVLKDEFYWRLWGLVGVSHFTALEYKEGGIKRAASSYFLPSSTAIDDMMKDAADIKDGVFQMGTDMDLSQLRVWNSLPLIGRTYQGWYGASSEKRIEELESGGWFRIEQDPAIAERQKAARERWLLERYGQE